MKKILTVLLALIMALIMTGCEKEKTENEIAIESLNAEDVDMSEYGVSNSDYFKKVTPEKLFEMMNVKEGEMEYNFFFGKKGCADCVKAAKICEKIAEELGIVVFYVDANELADNEDYSSKYMEYFGTYSNESFIVPFCVKVCDGVVCGFDYPDEIGGEMSDARMRVIYERLPEEYINEVVIPKANGTWEY